MFSTLCAGSHHLRGQKVVEEWPLEDGVARRIEIWLTKLGTARWVVAGVDQSLVKVKDEKVPPRGGVGPGLLFSPAPPPLPLGIPFHLNICDQGSPEFAGIPTKYSSESQQSAACSVLCQIGEDRSCPMSRQLPSIQKRHVPPPYGSPTNPHHSAFRRVDEGKLTVDLGRPTQREFAWLLKSLLPAAWW